ncbi:hypothetical protein [Nocardioides sp. TF02-7]|uniref:hypothetical protein n=1 Tax=Nocardioides sp. TF02-7 TaxID=2917724 RepID=UPI001F06B35E|nr:hypothetical protein [Nocardioides sp. TF02-7]UMG94443.1 hypothetical protein MF408_10920 [Nocardioides sp. TF02-7]
MTRRVRIVRARRRHNPFGARILGDADQSPRALRVRVQLLLTGVLLLTNLIGAVTVVVVSAFVVPSPAPDHRTWVGLAIAVPTYVAFAVVVGVLWGTATTLRALRWAQEGATPDADDRARALRAPIRLTAMQLALWGLATVVFTVLSVVLQADRAIGTGLTVGLASVVVCGIAYLLTEFALRPIAARAPGRRADDRPAAGAQASARGW